MKKGRLRTLAKYLKTVPPKHFSLSRWLTINGGSFKAGVMARIGCETSACALGWACQIPEFKKAGLVLVRDTDRKWAEGDAYPVFRGRERYYAAAAFFDIEEEDARDLFHPDHYSEDSDEITTAMVIERINDLLAKSTLGQTPDLAKKE